MLLKEVNATIITLVPKKINPSSMGDFRPISCCNVIYKCITKILSNRMLPFLADLVGMNQSAFIPSRSVAPQILIVLFLIYLFDNIIQLISLRSLWYYGGW
jgi:hypothetical protein